MKLKVFTALYDTFRISPMSAICSSRLKSTNIKAYFNYLRIYAR